MKTKRVELEGAGLAVGVASLTFAMRASEEYRLLDRHRLNNEPLYHLLKMGIFVRATLDP